jgi:hypothetical protein
MGSGRWNTRVRKPQMKPFDGAFDKIDTLEKAVAYRTVTTDFTLMQVARWLWPDDMVDKLMAAHPIARYTQTNTTEGPFLPCAGVKCTFLIKVEDIPMLAPAWGIAPPDHRAFHPDRGHTIVKALQELAHVHAEFNKVRTVVRWMNDHATPGAARFYFPGICSLLPPTHAVHQADGLRYKEPLHSMTEITPLLRQAGAIVTMGLLADPDHVAITATALGVKLWTGPEQDDASQQFMLI